MEERLLRTARPRVIVIPSGDAAFDRFVRQVARRADVTEPADLEARLVRLFPRVTVRPRGLSGEPTTWYVYRDGRWHEPADGQWWLDPRIPELRFDAGGWLTSANPAARTLLGVEPGEPHHYTDFVERGAGEDSDDLFRIVAAGDPLDATVRLQRVGTGPIACELHAESIEGGAVAWLRLANG